MLFDTQSIARILELSTEVPPVEIDTVVYDTRLIRQGSKALFVALDGGQRDGHDFVADAVKRGCVACIVRKDFNETYANVVLLRVPDTLRAYQHIAEYSRSQVDIPVVGITGSNGKTIVKEWLAQLLQREHYICKTPKSYNSQIGVAQSVLPISTNHTLGIFEAGISQPNEMAALTAMIKPTIGIFTTLGDAHLENFKSNEALISEKIKLFATCKTVICHDVYTDVIRQLSVVYPDVNLIVWGDTPLNNTLVSIRQANGVTLLDIKYNGEQHQFTVSDDKAIITENVVNVILCLLTLGYDATFVQAGIQSLTSLPMRLEIYPGIRNSVIVNDSYTSDALAFQYALDYIGRHYPDRRVVIITSLLDEGSTVTKLFAHHGVLDVHQIEPDIRLERLQAMIHGIDIQDSVVLVKGKHSDKLDRVSRLLSEKTHLSSLEVNLSAIGHNLNQYNQWIADGVETIAVVKASAYGSDDTKIAMYLAGLSVDTFAVAVIDEGIKLRNAGIEHPILVFNFFNDHDAHLLWKYQLEPEVFSLSQLDSLIRQSKRQNRPLNIHIKLDTGMHRLGFVADELGEVAQKLADCDRICVKSIFSHLSNSDAVAMQTFNDNQFEQFDAMYAALASGIGSNPRRHLLNTAGILNYPDRQYDAVRLGLGLYGIDISGSDNVNLLPVHQLKSTVIQIRSVRAGDYIGYGTRGLADRAMRIAIVAIGYADGVPRAAFSGSWSYRIGDVDCPLVAEVCMDVSIIEVPETVKAGDEVIIFGEKNTLLTLAQACKTIPYEILSQISRRVKRIFIEE